MLCAIFVKPMQLDTGSNFNPRTPRGGYHPLAFFPCNFFDDSNRENRLIVYVTRDGRHICDICDIILTLSHDICHDVKCP